MRVYWTTTETTASAVLLTGFTDLYSEFGLRGIYFATCPLDANDGFEGEVELCLDVPEGVFASHDITDEMQEQSGYRLALIPAAELNGLGRPEVYDHLFAGSSRRDLVHSARSWEGEGAAAAARKAQEIRRAIAFFDAVGWLTPVRLREEAAEQG
jgi:hypothetical protein